MDTTEQKRSVLIVVTVTAFLTPFMSAAVNIALPAIGNEFSMDAILLGWVATSYLLAAAMFIVPFGRISDIYGRKRFFTYGMSIYILASLLTAVAPSSLFLIASRVLQGIAGAMVFGTGVAMLMSVFPAGERGKALGITMAATYLGLSIGPFLGGVLTQHLGWRSIFLVNVLLSLVVIALIFWKLKGEWAEAKGEQFDAIGSLIYCLMIAAIMYGFSQLPALLGGWLILIGVVGIIAFVRREMRVEHPVFNIRIFRKNRVFAFSNVAALVNYSASFAIAFLLSLYLQYLKGFSPETAGLILMSQPVVMMIGSPLAGRLSDRIEPRVIASAGMAVMAVGISFFIFVAKQTPVGLIVADLIFLGFGYALFSSPNTNAVMSSVEKRFYGVASGTLGTMRLMGMMFSMGIAMMTFALYIGNAPITLSTYPLFLKGMRVAFIIFSLLCFGSVWASLVRGTVHDGVTLPHSLARPTRVAKVKIFERP
jgi:EmrB/QacA subfamily drug resistance transporter